MQLVVFATPPFWFTVASTVGFIHFLLPALVHPWQRNFPALHCCLMVGSACKYFTPPVLENRKASTDCSINAFVSFDTTIIAQVSLLKRANLSCSLLICPVLCCAMLFHAICCYLARLSPVLSPIQLLALSSISNSSSAWVCKWYTRDRLNPILSAIFSKFIWER